MLMPETIKYAPTVQQMIQEIKISSGMSKCSTVLKKNQLKMTTKMVIQWWCRQYWVYNRRFWQTHFWEWW